MRKLPTALGFCIVTCPIIADAQMYGAGNDVLGEGHSHLYEIRGIDGINPSLTDIGDMHASVGDLAQSDLGALYAVANSTVVLVNRTTGQLGPTIISGVGGDANAIAWGRGDYLYYWGYSGSVVMRYAMRTGQTTPVVSLPTTGADLAYDRTDGTIFASGQDRHLYHIDPSSGFFVDVGLVDMGVTGVSIACDWSGRLYSATASQSGSVLRIYSVNKSTAITNLRADFTSQQLGNFGITASIRPALLPIDRT